MSGVGRYISLLFVDRVFSLIPNILNHSDDEEEGLEPSYKLTCWCACEHSMIVRYSVVQTLCELNR